MLYIAWMVILGDHDVKNISFGNIAKMAEKVHKLHKRSSPLRPIQTLWSRDPETLFRLKIKKTKRFMIFDPKKGGVIF